MLANRLNIFFVLKGLSLFFYCCSVVGCVFLKRKRSPGNVFVQSTESSLVQFNGKLDWSTGSQWPRVEQHTPTRGVRMSQGAGLNGKLEVYPRQGKSANFFPTQ